MAGISEEAARLALTEVYASIMDMSEDEIFSSQSINLKEAFRRLDALAAEKVEEMVVERLIQDQSLKEVREGISRLRSVYSLRLEVEAARSILAGPDPWNALRSFKFYPNYLILAEAEKRGADLKSGDTVAFIGSGPLPLSLILLCSEYDLTGVGLERVAQWAELSREVLERLGLSSRIEILEGDHLSFPLDRSCDLVMVAAMAEPKEEIFRHLGRVLDPGTRVSYRIYERGLRRLLDSHPVPDLPPQLREDLRIRPEPPVNNTSVFLVRDDEE
jgi:SAM-dependent methyltransferase